MMGVGSFGHGGSSSPSNLSPLAPPFTFDRSFSINKPNPFVHSNEESYPYSFNPSTDNWLHLHPPTSITDSFSSSNLESNSIHDTALPSGNAYGYFGSQSISSLGTHLPSVNPITTTAIGAFPYRQGLETVTDSLFEAEPYFPQFPSPAIHETSPSLVANTPLENSSQTDYTQSLSGLGYTAQWGGFWNGLPDVEKERRKDLDGSLHWKENNGGGSSSTYKSYLKQGVPAAEGLTACEKVPSSQRKRVENSARKSHRTSVGTKWIDDKCLSVPEENILSSTNILQEIPYPQESSPISVMKSWSCYGPKNASYDRCFTHLDSFTADHTIFYPSAPNASSPLVFDAPAIGTSSSALKSISPKNIKPCRPPGNTFNSVEDSVGHILSNIKEPYLKLNGGGKEGYGNTSRINSSMGNDNIFAEFPLVKKDEPSDHKSITDDALDLFKAKSVQQVTHSNLLDAFNLAPGAIEAGSSVGNSSETSDQFNHAVDSPCWKGASASRHSPFRVADVVNSPHLVKELEVRNSLNLQGPQISPIGADDAVTVSFQKQGKAVYSEHGFVEESSSSFPKRPSPVSSTEHRIKEAAKAGSYHSKVRNGDGIQYSGGSNSTEIKHSHLMQLTHEDNFIFSRQLASDMKNAAQDCSVHAADLVTNSPSSEVGVPTELAEPLGGTSNTSADNSLLKIDDHVLVTTMHNLSELLLSSCSNDVDALAKQDHEVLQHVINNLNACLLKKVGPLSQMPESRFPQSGTFYYLKKPTDLDPGTGTDRPQVTRLRANDVQATFEGNMHCTVSCKKDDKMHYFSSFNDDTDMEKENDMTQAIKKVLKENFQDEEDLHPQALLYKNLWLETEAALCSMKYKARYARMRIEMEKLKSHQAGDVAEQPDNVEKLPSSDVSQDLNVDDTLSSETEEGLVSHVSTQNATQGSITSQAEDVEASVMARFRILKCRVDNSSLHKEGQGQPNAIDVGGNAGAVDTTPGQCSGAAHNVGMKSPPTDVVDLGFGERRNPWPFISGRWEGASLGVINKPTMQHHNPDDTEEVALDVSELHKTVKEFHVCVSDEPVIQSYISNRIGNQLPVGGYDSPSSDWEHVLKEELTWQNSESSVWDRDSNP